ncbi:hypothetical protein L1987_23716 [Smallanthus sonchifolius]|uniref:Uncharacterized protein n=1 Tax=Smallanthus sonchifolius TaxID=185202 RepID=A0ACB9IJ13_9ASTR|nr:hypothetical protein L1987_23716 [Smallanthus sonchifolius]
MKNLMQSPFVLAHRFQPRSVPAAGTVLNENEAKKQVLACPICYDMLTWNDDPVFSVSILECSICKKAYSGNETHLDLTITSGSKKSGGYMPASSEMFRLPLVSYLYERGWRQGFSIWGGFPGPEKEFEMMKDYLKPAIGGSIIDASCASGLNLILVRADIARLPFASSSIDAVHAGAALHCWPSPSAGADIWEPCLSDRELKDVFNLWIGGLHICSKPTIYYDLCPKAQLDLPEIKMVTSGL